MKQSINISFFCNMGDWDLSLSMSEQDIAFANALKKGEILSLGEQDYSSLKKTDQAFPESGRYKIIKISKLVKRMIADRKPDKDDPMPIIVKDYVEFEILVKPYRKTRISWRNMQESHEKNWGWFNFSRMKQKIVELPFLRISRFHQVDLIEEQD